MSFGRMGARGREVGGVPSWVLLSGSPSIASGIDMDFANGKYYGKGISDLTVARTAVNATDLTSTSTAAAPYTIYSSAIPRIKGGLGIFVEEARTQLLTAPTVPATQTTTSLSTGSYTLWVNGSGSAIASAGTASVTSATTAVNGTPNTFTVSGAGTVTVTVTGSLNAFQLEAGTFATSLIATKAARDADIVTVSSPPTFGQSYSALMTAVPASPTSNAASQYLLSIDDGTSNNRADIYRNGGTGNYSIVVVSGAATQWNGFFGTWAQATSKSMFMAISNSDFAWVATGNTLQSQASGTLPVGVNTITLGGKGGGTSSQWNGYISRAAIWNNSRISNATLTAIVG